LLLAVVAVVALQGHSRIYLSRLRQIMSQWWVKADTLMTMKMALNLRSDHISRQEEDAPVEDMESLDQMTMV
jgi:hypothetical protein